jgi:hypothetical protein
VSGRIIFLRLTIYRYYSHDLIVSVTAICEYANLVAIASSPISI